MGIMKRFLLGLLLIISVQGFGQVLQKPSVYGYQFRRLVVDTLFALPADTFSVPAALQSYPFLAKKGSSLYLWNTSTLVWAAVSGAGSTYTSSNGITLTGSNFKLGGTLVDATTTIDIDGNEFVIADGGTNRLVLEAGSSNLLSPTEQSTLGLTDNEARLVGKDSTIIYQLAGNIRMRNLNYTLSTTGKKIMLRDTAAGLVENIDPALLGGGGTPAGNFGNVQINRNSAFDAPGSDSLDFDGGLAVKGKGSYTDSLTVSGGKIMLTTTNSAGGTSGAMIISRTLNDGNAHHGIRDGSYFQTNQGYAAFDADMDYGSDAAGQDHIAGFQARMEKVGSQNMSNQFDFVTATSTYYAGTLINKYGYYFYNPTISGGVITNQYGIYLPAITGASNNFGVISLTKSGFGTASPDSMLTTTSLKATAGVRFSGIPSTQQAFILMADANGTVTKYDTTGLWAGGGGSGSPAGNFGNVQINRNGAFSTPASDSLDFESATGLGVKGNITSTGRITQASVGADINQYMETNSGDLQSQTNLNPGILVAALGGYNFGMDLGYESSRYSTRLFAASDGGTINFGKMAVGNATLQSSFTEWVVINNSGNMGIGVAAPTTKLQVAGRFAANQGADVASAAGAIALGSDGNTFEITGTNAITLISNSGWVNGSEINLIFTSTATLTDGTANSGTDIGMELAGNANFTASADDVLTLILTEIGGTQRWREKSRSVN